MKAGIHSFGNHFQTIDLPINIILVKITARAFCNSSHTKLAIPYFIQECI